MTIVMRGDDKVLEQVTKQLEKLIDVINVKDLHDEGVRRPRISSHAGKCGLKESA